VGNGIAIHSILRGSTICNTYKSYSNRIKTFVDRRRHASHTMLQKTSIIPHEAQTSEAQKCTNNLQWNSMRILQNWKCKLTSWI
jgi:hypothetical protein